jgi:hypothetical protein
MVNVSILSSINLMLQSTAPMWLCHLMKTKPLQNVQGGAGTRASSFALSVGWVKFITSLLVKPNIARLGDRIGLRGRTNDEWWVSSFNPTYKIKQPHSVKRYHAITKSTFWYFPA